MSCRASGNWLLGSASHLPRVGAARRFATHRGLRQARTTVRCWPTHENPFAKHYNRFTSRIFLAFSGPGYGGEIARGAARLPRRAREANPDRVHRTIVD